MSDPVEARPTFFELYCAGKVQDAEIDDFIDAWHAEMEARFPDERAPLHEYLGLTRAEYQEWVRDAGALPRILHVRRDAQPAAVRMASLG